MSISYNKDTKIFKLDTKENSYVFMVTEFGYLAHLYYGKYLQTDDLAYSLQLDDISLSPNPAGATDRTFSLDVIPSEYSLYGRGDFRESSIMVEQEDGSRVVDLTYKEHTIYSGKMKPEGLPATFSKEENDCATLDVVLEDEVSGLLVHLFYSVFPDSDVITRYVKVENHGADTVALKRVMSLCMDFDRCDFDFIHLHGAWARERHMERTPLIHGKQQIDSIRGVSSAQHNPFVALAERGATEEYGAVYAFNFIYSGNFLAEAEVNQLDTTRFIMGIHPMDFSWELQPGSRFETPEVVMVYSDRGFTRMTHVFHDFYRNHLISPKWVNRKRPILINNWEATYFDFDDEKLLEIARNAKNMGVEMLVMDDGWFGERNDDFTSLGDWFVNEKKIKCGLKRLVEQINEIGLSFGIWFEPEMVSPGSELHKKHPEWCVQTRNRSMSTSRSQYVLDMSREDVIDYIYTSMEAILSSAHIEYVKWDMNRNLTETWSALLPAHRQGEFWHRYVLGVYALYERLLARFPEILIEGCASGGARFDPGILYYSPQIWTSDDTDAIERLKIQYGTSLVYPVSAMGAHVSACPNHQTGRITPLKTRGIVALNGTFGYELDPLNIPEEDKDIVKIQIADYHKYHDLIAQGDLYRLLSPFDSSDHSATEYVSKDKKEVLVQYVRILAKPNNSYVRLRLKGLKKELYYRMEETGNVYSGDVLMNVGLNIPRNCKDFEAVQFYLTAV